MNLILKGYFCYKFFCGEIKISKLFYIGRIWEEELVFNKVGKKKINESLINF